MSWRYVLALLRIALGWIFLWAFLDKLFGLGFTTESGKSWLDGTSPATGFLKFGTQGPLTDLYQGMAGNAFVDWLYMLGLALIGLALMIGIGMKIASWTGSLLMLFIWLAILPPEHNPVIDEHIIYILVLLLLPAAKAGQVLGLGKWWSNTRLVQKYSILE